MSGFDSGTLQTGVYAQAKLFGSILRGKGPPVPAIGVVGDAYVDVQTNFLYQKRANNQIDPWGHHILKIADAYVNTLKWFSTFPPTNDFGVTGDYCIQLGGWANYGLEPSIYGPKQAYGWPEIGIGPDTQLDPLYAGTVLSAGLTDEGDELLFSNSTQIIVTGLDTEYILAIPTLLGAGAVVPQIGLQAGPVQVPMPLNPMYPATDTHMV